ncbi:LacI family DNA-binding transcriptional regulator [Propioniciclava soli]|uniref:LacI family DNA-binding transcriptional regulator n=1 Tax=Propioniciclava soli TaxID=2775081 RepID=UPI001E5144AD|nr:LacI family DNA-binding transcriptional regulator [Propioniciclava soli]
MEQGADIARARKPTLKDVANMAGVSPMTASRVIGDKGGVSAEMTRKVHAAAKKLGYARNEAARLMRPGQRSGLLGVIVTNIDNPYYAQVLLGVEAAAKDAGRQIITGFSHNDPRLEAELVRDLSARQIEGLIVVPARADAPHLAAAAKAGMPIALASRSINHGRVDTVLVDDIGAVRTEVGKLLDEGRHPIAFLGGEPTITTAARRYAGFVQAHTDAGVEVDQRYVRQMPSEPAAVVRVTRELLAMDEPPAAFFTANNRFSINVLRVLLDPHARWTPHSTAPRLVGFDTFELADLVPYPLTLIEHDAQALGRLAAELTLRRINSAERTPPITMTMPSVGVVHGLQPNSS